MKNLYLYFSGTGNTKLATEEFRSSLDDLQSVIQSIEHKDFDYDKHIRDADTIIIAYPIHDSMMPFIMKEFLEEHMESFRDKKIITLVTQLLFSGDGGALPYYLLRKVNVKLLHSIHINMPNNLTDVPVFKVKTVEESDDKLEQAKVKIDRIVQKIKNGKTIRMGRRWYSWMLGFFLQRVWGYTFIKAMRKMVKIDQEKCIQCNKCIKNCPLDNLSMKDDLVKVSNVCTLCYRCVNICPTQAISLMLKQKPKKQYIRKDYN